MSTTTDLSIHVFADANRRAMAAVAYSRVGPVDQESITRLLVAKTKLSQIRSLRPPSTAVPRMTIPRLKLRAALIAARLLHTICEELSVDIHSC
ncbi:hypothetical protein TKK_0015279 [Trichogramma kaykai]|uniref:Uncharacterized protein n=1 Tax=Trichogramma kaykai TaxID=54128 RepID=A0ABD2WAM0_9HYME